MRNILIIGGSKGIGNSILNHQLNLGNFCTNISRSFIEIDNKNYKGYQVDILNDDLPEINLIDSLVYCPGSITLKPFLQLKEEDFKNDFEVNVLGAVKSIQKYLNSLKKGTNPSIVLFSTVAVAKGMAFHSSISSAKAAIEGITKSLAAEFAPSVRVNCIAPTITKTDLAKNILRNKKIEENISNNHPLKKICEPDDIAAAANFLISKESNKITGQVMRVDSGMSTLKI
tara:strand:- start:389 stop:1075 length:687 start_codon:yes stop_codon:yes gene_type:complete